MNDQKTQLVEKLKSASNILVTVSAGPSVDQLAACIAMTLLLNKYKKNATAVFSGKVPSFLNFLKPADMLEKNTDSLRDFIIALDKSKADKLRYKVEDDVVKIFITPYKTSITENDLKYSAGEFNVDLILALGVHHQQDLDTAITAHGRIFHDAVTMSINNLPGGDFGVANWEDVEASSLSELIADLIPDLDPSLLDADIATALLTGIVAETGRFSNEKTHPRTMTTSSKLLEAGANQQLVNTQLQDLIGAVVNLEAGTEIAPTADTSAEPLHQDDGPGELVIDENGTFKPKDETPESAAEPAASPAPPESDQPVAAEQTAPESTPEIAPKSGNEQPTEPLPKPAEPADQPAASSTIESDADAARQAIEDALVSSPASPAEPAPSMVPAAAPELAITPPAGPSAPGVQAIAPNQPSYNNPLTTTQYDMPAVPEHEPAPLGMSPADQPFTMPMPPVGAMPAPPAFPAAPAPMAPAPSAAGMPVPPPLPPPMPPNFS